MTASEEAIDVETILDAIANGDHHALARGISIIEDRRPGYRELVSGLHRQGGHASILGVTGSPGVGKSTLVDELASAYRDRGETVGVIAIDPMSPFTGGSVLGDRVRMAENAGDMDVFVRSMSARGTLGGLSAATTDAITALEAFGKDRIIIETVGAGQNEIDVVRTADTVCVLVQPGTGDAVQTLKAGVLEIADVLVVNKSDREGADRLVHDLTEMVEQSETGGSHAIGAADQHATSTERQSVWTPPIVETVATTGDGIDELLAVLAEHAEMLEETGLGDRTERIRYRDAIRTVLRLDLDELLERRIEDHGDFESAVEAVCRGETDPYAVASDLLEPFQDCLDERS